MPAGVLALVHTVLDYLVAVSLEGDWIIATSTVAVSLLWLTAALRRAELVPVTNLAAAGGLHGVVTVVVARLGGPVGADSATGVPLGRAVSLVAIGIVWGAATGGVAALLRRCRCGPGGR